jgi:hypothetical protein
LGRLQWGVGSDGRNYCRGVSKAGRVGQVGAGPVALMAVITVKVVSKAGWVGQVAAGAVALMAVITVEVVSKAAAAALDVARGLKSKFVEEHNFEKRMERRLRYCYRFRVCHNSFCVCLHEIFPVTPLRLLSPLCWSLSRSPPPSPALFLHGPEQLQQGPCVHVCVGCIFEIHTCQGVNFL